MTLLLLLAVLLSLVLPGLGAGTLLSSYATLPARAGMLLARCLACGIGLWLIGSGVLARTVGITATSAWVLSALLAALGAGALLLPRSRAVLRGAKDEAVYAGGIVLATLLGWLPMGIEIARTSWSPLGSTPWYYWELASDVANAGRIPETVAEWGTQVPFLADYRLFSTSTATLLLQAPGLPVQVLAVMVLVGVVALGAGASLVAHAFGAGRIASLAAAPLAVGTGVGVARLSGYRPEGFGLGMLMLLVALVVDSLRHRDRTSLAAACVLAAVLSQVHGIALTSAGMFLVGAVVALLPWRRRRGDEPFLRRMGPPVGRAALAALCIGASVLVLATLLGGVSGSEQTGNLADKGGSQDLTWSFYRAARGESPSMPPSNLDILLGARDDMYGGDTRSEWVLYLAGASLVVVAVAARRRPEARAALLFLGASTVVLTAVGCVFAFGWQGFVPRRTGSQRLAKELTLLIGPLVAFAVAALPPWWRRLRRPVLGRVVPVALVCGLAAFGCSGIATYVGMQRPDRGDVEALADLDIPAGSLVLTNAYMEGYITQVTDGHGLLEGRAPYTYPGLLKHSHNLLRQARRFYEHPHANRAFLRDHHVDYVAVSRKKTYSLGTGNVFHARVRWHQLDRDPILTTVLARPALRVYRVDVAQGR